MEPDELPINALCRELQEELALNINPSRLRYLGQYSAAAANEPGHLVTAEIIHLLVVSEVVPAAEIEEVAWVDPVAPGDLALAPPTRDLILPLCAEPPVSTTRSTSVYL